MFRLFAVVFLSLASFAQQQQEPPSKVDIPPFPEHKISPAEADELFKSVDKLIQFASNDTGLPVRSAVKRKLISRDEVEKYVTTKLNEDEDTKRFERSELILKKFGMLPKEFHLRPLLIKLLREQVAGFYDAKEKTINLLDWLTPDAQLPVMAHELTHALQDQQIDLQKWLKEPDSLDVKDDYNKGVRSDEASLARTSVVEGQAMVVFIEYLLSQTNRTLLDSPGIVPMMQQMASEEQKGALGNAPLVVRESLIFPYREGFGFAYEVLKSGGKKKAFEDLLQHPPVNSRQIIAPATYLNGEKQPDPKMPELKSALKGKYAKYDSGAVGEFDTKMLLKQFNVARAEQIAGAWRGGMYYAGQRSEKSPKDTADIALLYVSDWRDEASAREFQQVYEGLFATRYPGIRKGANGWQSGEGDLRVVRQGSTVVVSEGFDIETAKALEKLVSSKETQPAMALDHSEIGLSIANWWAMMRHNLN